MKIIKMNVVATLLLLLFLIVFNCRADGNFGKKCGSDDCFSKGDQIDEKEGSNYLRKVIKQLERDRFQSEIAQVPSNNPYQTHRSQNVFNLSHFQDDGNGIWTRIPPLLLSKEELLTLYDEAVSKLNFFKDESRQPVNNDLFWDAKNELVRPSEQGQLNGPHSDYYYYYFPLKTFSGQENKPETEIPEFALGKSPHQVHATVTMIDSSKKSIEPLFVAISGFIGMTLFFLFSILFLPGFHGTRSKSPEEEVAHLGQILFQAMAGGDCSERFACEFVRIFTGLKSNDKTLRILEIILPPNLAKKITYIRKAAGKRTECGYIYCKMNEEDDSTGVKSGIKTYKAKPLKSDKTPHDLWMKHFEKNEVSLKKWQKNSPNRKPPCKNS